MKIINLDELEICLNNIIENNKTMFEIEEMHEISLIVDKYQDVNETIKEKHINDIKRFIYNK